MNRTGTRCILGLAVVMVLTAGGFTCVQAAELPYTIVDTGQTTFYTARGATSEVPQPGERFYGQDAQYTGNVPAYTDNGDGTVSDLNTGLMWEQGFRFMDWEDAAAAAASCTTGGYTDWRVPSVKELYSLMNFSGSQGGQIW